MEKISVIITTHKGANTVARAVESVFQQQYENTEIIVVDDNGKGSDEQIKTELALRKYIDNEQLTYIAHEVNKNGSAARNTGFFASTGEYIGFLDDDDIYLNNKLAASVAELEKLGAEYGAVYSDVRISYANGSDYAIRYHKAGNLLFEMLTHTVFANPGVWVLRREAVIKLNGFDDTFKRHQDFEFNARLAYNYKVGHIKMIGSQYNSGVRRHYNPQLALEYRNYYLLMMKDIIMTLPVFKQKIVYARNAMELLGIKLKKRKEIIALAKSWGCNCGNCGYFGALFLTVKERMMYRLGKEKR